MSGGSGKGALALQLVRREKAKRRKEVLEVLLRNPWTKAALMTIGALAGMTVIGLFYTPHDPFAFNLAEARKPPSLEYPLGTDELGRDILSRIMHGGRYTLGISFLSVLLGTAIGVTLGALAGYYGGKVDIAIMRGVDVLLAFPTILLAIALVAAIGPGVKSLILAIAVSTSPVYARLVRSAVLQVMTEDYVVAAKMLGLSGPQILLRHVLPNVASIIIVQMSYYMGLSILIASALGFLGLGIPSPKPEWGTMVGTARAYLFSNPHIVVIPGLFILAAAVSFNVLGDGLREAVDPRLRQLLRRG